MGGRGGTWQRERGRECQDRTADVQCLRPVSCPFRASCQQTQFKCHQSSGKGSQRTQEPRWDPAPLPRTVPTHPVRALWVLRPRCPRWSGGIVLTHSCLQAARSSEAPCWAQRDTCPCHPLPRCVHPHEAALFPEAPGHQLQSGWRTFPGPSHGPGTCRTSLGHQPAQNLPTRREQALGGLFLPGERPPLCGSTNPASQDGELVSGSWETLPSPYPHPTAPLCRQLSPSSRPSPEALGSRGETPS